MAKLPKPLDNYYYLMGYWYGYQGKGLYEDARFRGSPDFELGYRDGEGDKALGSRPLVRDRVPTEDYEFGEQIISVRFPWNVLGDHLNTLYMDDVEGYAASRWRKVPSQGSDKWQWQPIPKP